MPAGVHDALYLRGPRHSRFLINGQRVHVCTQSDCLPTRPLLPVNDADDTSSTDAGYHFITTETSELGGDQLCSSMNFEAEFGMRMDIAPPGDHIRVVDVDPVHACSSRFAHAQRERH